MRRLVCIIALWLASGCLAGRASDFDGDRPDELAEDAPAPDPDQPPPDFDMLEPDPDPLPPDRDAEPDPETDPFPDPGPAPADVTIDVAPCDDLCAIGDLEYDCCSGEQ